MPTWEQFMVPALRVLSDGHLRSRRELFALVADEVALPAELRDEMLNSGQPRYVNRIGWALSGLSRAGAIVRPQRGRNQITDLGRSLLAQHPNGLTEKDLREIPAYRDYVPVERTAATQATATEPAKTSLDPVEQIAEGYERLKTDVALVRSTQRSSNRRSSTCWSRWDTAEPTSGRSASAAQEMAVSTE